MATKIFKSKRTKWP